MGNLLLFSGIGLIGGVIAGKGQDIYTFITIVVTSDKFIPWLGILALIAWLTTATNDKNTKQLGTALFVLLLVAFLLNNKNFFEKKAK